MPPDEPAAPFSPGRRITIADVALRAGVSPTTVSHALSGRRPVSEATQRLVRQTIAELGFRPNEIARALRTQRSQLVAMVIANIAHTSYQEIAHAVMAVMHPQGYMTAIYDVAEDPAYQTETIRAMTDRGVDGVLFFGVDVSVDDACILTEAGTPFVETKQTPQQRVGWDVVASDAEGGAEQATLHIAGSVDGPIAFFGGPAGDLWTPGRLEGFRRAMRTAGREVDETLVLEGTYSRDSGRRLFDELLARGVRARGIVCANDLIALGAMARALDRGLRVPDDVAISGFDNIEACDMVSPALTSIENHQSESGRVSAQLLLDRIAGDYSGPPRRVLVPTELVVRASTAKVAG